MKASIGIQRVMQSVVMVFLTTNVVLYGQRERKELIAARTEVTPRIDGILNDKAWIGAPEAKDFYQYNPYNDRSASFPTIVSTIR